MATKTRPKRDAELSTRAPVRKHLLEVLNDVEEGFRNQRSRSDGLMDNWDAYNQKLGSNQFYNGNTEICTPYVQDAVNARKTRFTNQIFPKSGRYVDVITTDGEVPHATISLLDHYVRLARLRTVVMPALCVNGDVEGQYNVYVSWRKIDRSTVQREQVADQKDFPELGTHVEYTEDQETIEHPHAEVLHDADVLILPVTCDTVDDAIEQGGSVTILRRWSKAKIRDLISSGDIVKEEGELLIKAMKSVAANKAGQRDTGKDMADAIGVKAKGNHALIYETWTKVKVNGERQLCRVYFGGDNQVLGCKRNPYWCDRVPLITAAVQKVAGVVKGKPPVDGVLDYHILANDTINEGADTSHFSAMPIVMTDPLKNPRTATMVLGLAAVWETSPNDTQFAEFPELWRTALERAEAIKTQIFQTLGVNPSMMPQGTGGKQKRNQAEIANEQQVDILTTADAVTVIEEDVLNPLLRWFADLDHQFREKETLVAVFGELGVKAMMEAVEPIQAHHRWEFVWLGVEAARNAAAMQQQIAGMNVLNGIPPERYAGYELNLAPLIEQMAENLFGPRLAPLIFKKQSPITVDPQLENEMLDHGHVVNVHEADNDEEHLMAHMALAAQTGDMHGTIREHIGKHQKQLQKKQQAAMQQQMAQGGLPGVPGGGGPGVAGTPGGAQPGNPRMKGPPGMIHPDQMAAAGAPGMPRKM